MEPNTFEIPDLEPGHSVTLRRKGPGQVWTARIKAPSITGDTDFGRIERSTRRRDLEDAKRDALRLYHQALLGKAHVEARPKKAGRNAYTFKDAVKAFLESEAEKVKSGERSASQYERERISLSRHFVPFFGEKTLPELTKRDLGNFITRRLLNTHRPRETESIVYLRAGKSIRYDRKESPPTIETLRRERTDFQALISWCVEQGKIDEAARPIYPPLKGPGGRREAFSPEAIQHLQHVSLARIRSARNPKIRRDRIFCHLRMMFIYLTGCRPQEVAGLRFDDVNNQVRDKNGNLVFKIMISPSITKHHTHARLVVTPEAFYQVYKELVHIDRFSPPESNGRIFIGSSGNPLGSCNKSFRALVKAANKNSRVDVPETAMNVNNPYYSLRHTFITERLYEGEDVYRLARLCGTSIEMIERHYGHVRTEIEQTKKISNPGPYIVPIPDDLWEKAVLFDGLSEDYDAESLEPLSEEEECAQTEQQAKEWAWMDDLPPIVSRSD